MLINPKPKTIAFTCITAFILVASAFFVTTFPPTETIWLVSVAAICLFFTPVFVGACRWLGFKRALLLIIGFGIYAVGFESVAVLSGIPYGHFSYSTVLGPKLAGIIPYIVFLAWTPLLLGVIRPAMSQRGVKTIIYMTVFLVIIDAVLDPAAVQLGFWHWKIPGLYYGVPLINYLGWVLSGCIAASILVIALRRFNWPLPPKLLTYSLLATVFFWGSVNTFLGQWLPVLLAVVLMPVLLFFSSRADAVMQAEQ